MRYELTTAIVIDDNDLTVQVLYDYLKMIGVQVLGSGHNGRDAVNLYETLGQISYFWTS